MAVMPPRNYLVDVLPTLLPESPFLLTAQAIMTLAPHALDPNPASPNSKRLRSAASNALAQRALKACETAVGSLEVIQCLTMIAVWEWGTTNDAQAAMTRAGQAVILCRQLGITSMDAHGSGFSLEGIDWRADMMRRTWWILYVYQLSAGLVSGLTPPVPADDPSIKVDFPICSDKDRTWSTWINCMRQCTRVVNIVNELVYANAGGGFHSGGGGGDEYKSNLSPEAEEARRRQIVQIDRQIMDLMKETERMSVVQQVPGGEEDVVKNQHTATRFGLAVAHIHLHRSTAAPEVSLFSKRICGFPKASTESLQDGLSFTDVGRSAEIAQVPLPGTDGPWNDRRSSFQSSGPFTSPSGAPQLPPVDFGAFDVNQLFDAGPSGQVAQHGQVGQQPTGYNGFTPPFTASPTQHMAPLSYGQTPPYPQTTPYHPQQPLPNSPPNAQQWQQTQAFEEATEDMWQPESYPNYLPQPWFAHPGGAAALYIDPRSAPTHAPAVLVPGEQQASPPTPSLDITGSYQSNLAPVLTPPPVQQQQQPQQPALPQKKHKAWGVNDKGDPLPAEDEPDTFPPGLSLARCATAAHTIVRLEVLHRSAALALDGTPKWIPFCSCGLVSGAYAFLLLLLAVQAENAFGEYSQARIDEAEQLLTNVKIILAGLEAYGTMWEGIDMMAREVRAAIDAATNLPAEVQSSRTGSLHSSLSPESGAV